MNESFELRLSLLVCFGLSAVYVAYALLAEPAGGQPFGHWLGILGTLGKRGAGLTAEKFPGKRLHVRAIVRDGQQAFLGSQGLRKLELDGRREVGVIVRDPKVWSRMAAIFESDWALTDRASQDRADARKDGKTVARIEAAAAEEVKAAGGIGG